VARSIFIRPAAVFVAGALVGGIGGSAHAQDSTRIVSETACVAHLPPSVFTRVAVYAYVHVDSGVSRSVRFEAEDFLPDVAAAVTRMLHGTPNVVPRGDSAVSWRGLDATVNVTAYRNGHFSWRVRGSPRTDGVAPLLERALQSAASAGATIPLVADDAGVTPDSIMFSIETAHPTVDRGGHVSPMTAEGASIPIFSLPVPWSDPVSLKPGNRPPKFPYDARDHGAVATVVEMFVVDSTGHVDPSTIHEKWPANTPAPQGDRGRYWREFVSAVHEALASFRYTPASLGGCPVAQVVSQPFQFSLRSY
jgi:hypothetical protein